MTKANEWPCWACIHRSAQPASTNEFYCTWTAPDDFPYVVERQRPILKDLLNGDPHNVWYRWLGPEKTLAGETSIKPPECKTYERIP